MDFVGYIGSNNFGVLYSCFVENTEGFYWKTYLFLSRLSKAIGFLDGKFGDLPKSRMFSPYIYAISRVD